VSKTEHWGVQSCHIVTRGASQDGEESLRANHRNGGHRCLDSISVRDSKRLITVVSAKDNET